MKPAIQKCCRARAAKFILLCQLLLLAACSEGGSPFAITGCSIAQQNETVHKTMLDSYYWYDRVASSIDYNAFASPAETLDYLRYATLDRFSYISPQADFSNFINNGTYLGYGFAYKVESDDSVWVQFVYTLSPATTAGLQRGDRILSVNGQPVASIIAADSWGSVFGADLAGLPLALEIQRNMALQTLSMSKATVTINTVLFSDIIDNGTNKIGYLVFNNFLNTSTAEFAPVFAQFKTAGVDRLILDLRYNGGGSVPVGRELASYIKSSAVANSEVYVELRYNNRHPEYNFAFYFSPRANSLGLAEVTVITSEATCSASEQLISGLDPYLDVTTIGSRSCGKPVGMNPLNFCDSTLLAVNFASFNANRQGDYYSGIPADCAAGDDLAFALGDPAEPMLQAARHYVENRSCLTTPRPQQQPARRPAVGLEAMIGAV